MLGSTMFLFTLTLMLRNGIITFFSFFFFFFFFIYLEFPPREISTLGSMLNNLSRCTLFHHSREQQQLEKTKAKSTEADNKRTSKGRKERKEGRKGGNGKEEEQE